MKNLHLFDKEIDFESVKEKLERPWVSLVEETKKSSLYGHIQAEPFCLL